MGPNLVGIEHYKMAILRDSHITNGIVWVFLSYPKCSKYSVRRCLGTQNHLQKGLEHKGTMTSVFQGL